MDKQQYYHISYFENYLEGLKVNKKTFTLISTTYTKKILQHKAQVFFNDKGDQDFRLLSLITSVRKDAKQFMEREGEIQKGKIDFFNMFEVPTEDQIICKIDLTAAYWTYALKRGIIKPETNQKLIRLYGVSKKKVKQSMSDWTPSEKVKLKIREVGEFKTARLKALGSLATMKTTTEFERGYRVSEETKEEPTKEIYMEICRGIDELMKECHRTVPGCIYYYWDCIFVKKEFSAEVLEFFKEREYNVSMQETRIDFVKIGSIGYLISSSDDKIYMTRRENKHLIKEMNEDED